MELQPDYSKLASAKLPPEELQAAFSAMLMNAAAIDCGTVIDPDVRHAEFGESLAMVRQFSPYEENLYKLLLGDYLRFCRMYIKESGVTGACPQGMTCVRRIWPDQALTRRTGG